MGTHLSGGNAPRRKGALAEQRVVSWLRSNGFPDARRFLAGDGRQPGDIDGVPGVCLDIKNANRYQLTQWLTQLDEEARAGALPFLVVKLPRITDPGEWALITRVRELPRITDAWGER